MYLDYYLDILDYENIPNFLIKYLNAPSLLRLKKISYFCGMDYASKEIYNFREYISRYDHSLTTALLIYKLTNNKLETIAGLLHDIATPVFSHVIDYMNKDYFIQESTEEYTEQVILNDKYLLNCFKIDKINFRDIVNFKKYTVVDNDRPKLCADRLDGIILTGISWTKNIEKEDIKNIIDNIELYKNEFGEIETGFKTFDIANTVININNKINKYCHSSSDIYMMELLANITKYSINKNYITYNDLYIYDEEYIYNKLKNSNDLKLQKMIKKFETIKLSEIDSIKINNLKIRNIDPLIKNRRFSIINERKII